MAIKLDIALEKLAAPGVAEALARLVGALGDPTAKVSPRLSDPPRLAEEPAVSAPKAAPVIAEDAPDAAERYRRFVAGLPDRSRTFIEMVQTHKLLKISDAMRALGLTAPKAMGGLTGSIGRWAPNRGVKVPYETTTADGERAWRWIGSPVDAAPAPAAKRASETPTMLPAGLPPELSAPPAAAAPPVEVAAQPDKDAVRAQKAAEKAAEKAQKAADKAAEKAAEKAQKSADKAAERAQKSAAKSAEKAAEESAEVATEKAAAKSVSPDFRDFEGLPEKSQEFLMLVATRGLVTREEALVALDYRRPKELGGATEPIIRRCREREIDRPYVAGKRDGKRVWMWPTHPVPDDVLVT